MDGGGAVRVREAAVIRDVVASTPRDHATVLIAFGVTLAVLYFGRGVLVPLAVSLVLSLLIAPLVRALRRVGFGHTASVIAAVLAAGIAIAALSVLVVTQVVGMAAELPRYEHTIQGKLQALDEMTLGRLTRLGRDASRVFGGARPPAAPGGAALAAAGGDDVPENAIPVEVHAPPPDRAAAIGRLLATAWPPLETCGIVLLVLVFVLLEHEAIRDRFIRLAGGTSIHLTTQALGEASTRLSRYFASQALVNVSLGTAIGLGLAALGLPHAMMWGVLAALLRFVPYIGIWIAALLATALSIGVAPGWSLAIETASLFLAIELLTSQAVEPYLYGHATGLSPLSVVVAAIFWGTLWGPAGMILSTPLTLGMLLLGRHVKGLAFLELVLTDAPALSLPQRFYQRALAGDAEENISVGRAFLARHSFAGYCDAVLLPTLRLSLAEQGAGRISAEQQAQIHELVVRVVSTLGAEGGRRSRRPRRPTVLDANPGRALRRQREDAMGRWQGPLAVSPRSIFLCVGVRSTLDVLAAELLVRSLRAENLDARHASLEDLEGGIPGGADPASVAIVYLVDVSGDPQSNQAPWVERLGNLFAGAEVVPVDAGPSSFARAVEIARDRPRR